MSTERRRAPVDDGLFVVGLIGRAGSGKSTIARTLAAAGAEVIEADALGHLVTDRDPHVRAALVAEYGADVYHANGALDRAKVAAKVFRDPAALTRLDRLVHPRILDLVRARLDELRANGFRGPVVIDAALLLDWELERDTDAVIAVTADEDEIVARLVRSRGWDAAEARRRLAVQRSRADLAAASDVALDNDGTTEALERTAREALARLLERHAARLAAGRDSC